MVNKNRSSRKTCPIVDVSPLRNRLTVSANKYEISSSPRIGYKLELPRQPLDTGSSAFNQWHYNNMIKTNRGQFNNLHFC